MATRIEVQDPSAETIATDLAHEGETVETAETVETPETEVKPDAAAPAEPVKVEAKPKADTSAPAKPKAEVPTTEDEDWEKLPDWAKKRITKLTAKNRELRDRQEGERAETTRVPADTTRETTAVAETAKPPEGFTFCGRPKPKLSDFSETEDPYAAHADALAEWHVDEKEAKKTVEAMAQRQIAEQQQMFETFETRKAEAREIAPDFDETLEEATDLQASGVMQEVIYTSEVGPHILLHLAKNPEECQRIFGLGQYVSDPKTGRVTGVLGDPRRALREMHKLEARIEAEVEKARKAKTAPPAEPPKRKTTPSAPRPETPLRGGNARLSADHALSTENVITEVIRPNRDYRKQRQEERRGR